MTLEPVSVQMTVAAERDFRRAKAWYRKKSRLTARRFHDYVREALRQVVETPLTWPPLDDEHRFFCVDKFPYIIVYLLIVGEPLVTGILHDKRSDKVWKKRKKG